MVALTASALLAGRLRFSAIPVFIGAGIILGPGEPSIIHIVDPSEGTDLLAELGIVLLLFFLGLEFSIGRLQQSRRLLVVGGTMDLLVAGGASVGLAIALVGPGAEAVLLAGLIYISSSAVITRALFDLRRLADPETDLVLGTLVFEDLAIALFLGVAAALASGDAASPVEIGGKALVSLAFVVVFLLASRGAPRYIDRWAERLGREQLLLATLALAIGAAALAELVGLSAAIGALLAGILISESEIRDDIEQQLIGLRDFAAGIFFFSFGLSVELGRADEVALWLAVGIPVAVVAKAVAGFTGGRLVGLSKRRSLNAGAALVARGEFTIILSQLAVSGAALDAAFREDVGIFAGIFVVATTAVGVLFMRESRRIGRLVFPEARAKTEQGGTT